MNWNVSQNAQRRALSEPSRHSHIWIVCFFHQSLENLVLNRIEFHIKFRCFNPHSPGNGARASRTTSIRTPALPSQPNVLMTSKRCC